MSASETAVEQPDAVKATPTDTATETSTAIQWVKAIISGLLAGLIAFGSGLTVALQTLPPDAPFSSIPAMVWVTVGVAALLAAAKDWQSILAKSPRT